jgi:hypothetical protein
MTDDKMQPNPNGNDRPEQAAPEEPGQQAQQGQPNKPADPGQRVAPGRRPLFRN